MTQRLEKDFVSDIYVVGGEVGIEPESDP
jgi:hypothetical protein